MENPFKHINQPLKEVPEELKSKVKAMTSELENANNALDLFSHSVSHDLRAPLRAINGFSGLLEKKFQNVLGSEGLRLLEVITTSATKMDHLILGLQALSTVTRMEIAKISINTDDMVRSCISEVLSSEDRSQITFKVENLIPIIGDPKLIRKVWVNLIENAVKYSRKKEKPIVQITNQLENNFVVFCVNDNGAGFNPEYQYKLFDLFHKLHDIDEFTGIGVGLAIVDSIVQKHGGKVWAKGIEGIGATFYFSIPIAE